MNPSSRKLKPESRVMELLFHQKYVAGFVIRGDRIEHFILDMLNEGFIDRLEKRGFIKEVRRVLAKGSVSQDFIKKLGAEVLQQLPHEEFLLKLLNELDSLLSGGE